MKIGVTGISGRMGRQIAQIVHQSPIAQLSSGLVRQNSDFNGKDIGSFLAQNENNRKITADIDNFFEQCDAIIDFSSPNLSLECAKKAAQHKKILVCGTTGFSDQQKENLISYSQQTVIIWSSNMSVGVNLLMGLVEKVSSILHDDYDIEILEMHHKNKIDSPSGTALSLGESAAKGRNENLKKVANMVRNHANSPRAKGEIGFATLRGGDVIGDHSVMFAGEGERLELSHKASNRSVFASGAVRAAIWGANQENGFYSMQDVLGL